MRLGKQGIRIIILSATLCSLAFVFFLLSWVQVRHGVKADFGYTPWTLIFFLTVPPFVLTVMVLWLRNSGRWLLYVLSAFSVFVLIPVPVGLLSFAGLVSHVFDGDSSDLLLMAGLPLAISLNIASVALVWVAWLRRKRE